MMLQSTMTKPAQLKLPTLNDFTRTEHGGALRAGKRKLARPVATKRPMHLVMRSTRARAGWSMASTTNSPRIHAIVFGSADRFRVQILRFANVGNHLHLVVQAKTRGGFQAFL